MNWRNAPPSYVAWVLFAALCACLQAAGCGGGTESSANGSTSNSASQKVRTIDGKSPPGVTFPDAPEPRKLFVQTLQPGHGPRARVGDRVKVEFVGAYWDEDVTFDTWTYRSPPVFELGGQGGARMYHGLDLGVRGMRPGGRRKVSIPPKLIFWRGSTHPPFNRVKALVFVVDLLAIEKRH